MSHEETNPPKGDKEHEGRTALTERGYSRRLGQIGYEN
jgi:hypothetical protein